MFFGKRHSLAGLYIKYIRAVLYRLLYFGGKAGEDMKRRKNIFLAAAAAVVLILLQVFSVQAEGTVQSEDTVEPGNLYALSAVLLDGESGRVLYEKEGQVQRPMASTTKIMTCILVLENGNLEDKAKTSSYAASIPKVHLGAAAGEEFYVKDLLYSLMLESHNDSAVILAEHVGGSKEGFAAMMNEKAEELGCRDTFFITPNGLDAQEETEEGLKTHSTTAEDLARIMKYCIKDSPKAEEFLEITRTPSYSFTDVSGNRSFSCINHNAFLTMMDGALSGKTGFTANAGYCYVGALEDQGRTFIVALLGCGWPNNKSYKWADTRKLMEYGMENYEYHSFSEAVLPEIPESIPVEDGQNGSLGETASVPLVRIEKEDSKFLLRKDEDMETAYTGKGWVTAPVSEGEKVGELTYRVNGKVWRTEEVVTAGAVEKIDFPWCFRQTVKKLTEGPEW